jgi:hypothetical protein
MNSTGKEVFSPQFTVDSQLPVLPVSPVLKVLCFLHLRESAQSAAEYKKFNVSGSRFKVEGSGYSQESLHL